MTFKEFNKINNILTYSNVEIRLVEEVFDEHDGYYHEETFGYYNSSTDIETIFEDVKNHPYAKFVVYDDDVTTPLEEWK